jgi:hypothetical protein
MTTPILTPKRSGPHRRYTGFSYSMKLAVLALVTVFIILTVMYFVMPPMG